MNYPARGCLCDIANFQLKDSDKTLRDHWLDLWEEYQAALKAKHSVLSLQPGSGSSLFCSVWSLQTSESRQLHGGRKAWMPTLPSQGFPDVELLCCHIAPTAPPSPLFRIRFACLQNPEIPAHIGLLCFAPG